MQSEYYALMQSSPLHLMVQERVFCYVCSLLVRIGDLHDRGLYPWVSGSTRAETSPPG